jgi:hypothetical protein
MHMRLTTAPSKTGSLQGTSMSWENTILGIGEPELVVKDLKY